MVLSKNQDPSLKPRVFFTMCLAPLAGPAHTKISCAPWGVALDPTGFQYDSLFNSAYGLVLHGFLEENEGISRGKGTVMHIMYCV